MVTTDDAAEPRSREAELLERLARSNRALKTLSAVNQVIIHGTDPQAMIAEMCAAMVDLGGYFCVAIELHRARAEHGARPAGGPTQVIPLAAHDREFGRLDVWAGRPLEGSDLHLLFEMGADLAYGLAALAVRDEREAQRRMLHDGLQATVAAMAATIEMRDPFTAGHQTRVAHLAVAIAHAMALPEDEVEGVRLAAAIHDIGKICVPAEILTRPRRLTPAEFNLVRRHAQAGYDVLKSVPSPWPLAEMVLQHHERMDGSGYPAGLRGDEILVGARIIAVADVFEAMVAHRPYRAAHPIETAVAELTAGRGTRYDAAVVDACIRCLAPRRQAAE